MSNLWVCKNCQCVGRPSWQMTSRRRMSSIPACSSCGHKTIVPVDSPKGNALVSSLGITSSDLEIADYESYSEGSRVIGILVGLSGTIYSLSSGFANIGIGTVLLILLAVGCGLSLYGHYRSKPTDPPPPET